MAFAVLAYCVMPDHVHLLVHGRRHTSDLRRFVKRVKQSTGQRYSQKAKRPLWQEGYYDRVLRPEEAEAMVARYIIENPVRAGLVTTPSDYPYVGSDEWSLEEIVNAIV
jgi:putative transposase